jgi:hypothetical protein
MTANQIQEGTLAVQILALAGLIAYVLYTAKLAKAAREQIAVSRDMLHAAMDQAEGTAKPCVVLASRIRDREEALNEIGGAKGSLVVDESDDGLFMVENIGNGVALNVTFKFDPIDPPHGKGMKGNDGKVQNIPPGQKAVLHPPVKMAQFVWEVTLEFDSLGGRRYQTKMTLGMRVLTDISFKEIGQPRRPKA